MYRIHHKDFVVETDTPLEFCVALNLLELKEIPRSVFENIKRTEGQP